MDKAGYLKSRHIIEEQGFMDLKHLRYIITIAQEKNITKAAEKLYISQSSLSYTLSAVEKEIGMPLFIRQKNGVILTAAGEKYFAAAKKIVTTYDNLMNDFKNMNEDVHINIAASSVWGTKLFSELIPEFRRKYPNVSFSLTQVELFYLNAELKDDSIDFAFISLSCYDRLSNQMHILRNEPLLLAVPADHPYVEQNAGDILPAEDLETYFSADTFLLSRVGSANRKVVEHLFAEQCFTPKNIFEVNGVHLTRNMVASGSDVAFIPLSGCEEDRNVHYYHVDPEIYRYQVLLSKPQANYNDMQKAFYKFILAHFRA